MQTHGAVPGGFQFGPKDGGRFILFFTMLIDVWKPRSELDLQVAASDAQSCGAFMRFLCRNCQIIASFS
jgi:hypothetical protein